MFSIYQLLSLCDSKDTLRTIQRIYKLSEQPEAESGFPFACTAIYLSTLMLSLVKSVDLKVRLALRSSYLAIVRECADDSTKNFHYLNYVSVRADSD